MKLEILYAREGGIFIAKKDGKHYLVNLNHKTCSIAEPPDSPDMFLKFGYFEKVSPGGLFYHTIQEVERLIKNHTE